MTMQDLGQDRDVYCRDLFDPDCPGVAEPEQDGDHRYYTCRECGNDFGWKKENAPTLQQVDSCAAGVPLDVRKAASAPMEAAMATRAKLEPVPLTLGFGRPK